MFQTDCDCPQAAVHSPKDFLRVDKNVLYQSVPLEGAIRESFNILMVGF